MLKISDIQVWGCLEGQVQKGWHQQQHFKHKLGRRENKQTNTQTKRETLYNVTSYSFSSFKLFTNLIICKNEILKWFVNIPGVFFKH